MVFNEIIEVVTFISEDTSPVSLSGPCDNIVFLLAKLSNATFYKSRATSVNKYVRAAAASTIIKQMRFEKFRVIHRRRTTRP